MTPTKQLQISSRSFDSPLTISLPENVWSNSSLQSFDENNNGTITISVDAGFPDSRTEVSFANNSYKNYNSADEFGRVFRNLRPLSQTEKDKIFDSLLPALNNSGDASWEAVKRTLFILGDSDNLSQLGKLALDENNPQVAEDYLLGAIRLAAIHKEDWPEQNTALQALITAGTLLDEQEGDQFLDLTQTPYLLAGSVSTMTSIVDANKESSYVAFIVGVPPKWADAHNDTKQALLNFFENNQTISALPGKVNDSTSSLKLPLLPVEAIEWSDERSRKSSRLYSTPLINEPYLNNLVFGGDKIYYQVVFEIPNSRQALDGYPSRKMDLLFATTDGQIFRKEKGVLNLVKADDTTPFLIISDPHVAMDDFENIKDIITGLEQKLKNGEKLDPMQIEEVERFYASANERTIALLNEADNRYRRKEISKVIMLGDLYDYANRAITLEKQGYHLTNARLFTWMLENSEVPVEGITGNHEWHGVRWTPQDRRAYYPLISDPAHYLREITNARFPYGGNEVESLNALALESSKSRWNFPIALGKRVIFEQLGIGYQPFDDTLEERDNLFIGLALAHLAPYQNYISPLGQNNTRIVYLDTGAESHNAKFLYDTYVERLGEKLNLSFLELIKKFSTDDFTPEEQQAIKDLARDTRLNGVGPDGENLLQLSNTLEEAKQNGENILVATHIPLFNHVTKKEPPYDVDDVIDYPTNHALRIIIDMNRRNVTGVISGHLHIRSSVEASFNLTKLERFNYETEVKFILAKQSPDTLINDLEAIWQRYKLDEKLNVLRGTEVDGYAMTPDEKSVSYITVDGLGLNDQGDETGSTVANSTGNSINLDFDNLYLDKEQKIVTVDRLSDYRDRRTAELDSWRQDNFYARREDISDSRESWLEHIYSPLINPLLSSLKSYSPENQICSAETNSLFPSNISM